MGLSSYFKKASEALSARFSGTTKPASDDIQKQDVLEIQTTEKPEGDLLTYGKLKHPNGWSFVLHVDPEKKSQAVNILKDIIRRQRQPQSVFIRNADEDFPFPDMIFIETSSDVSVERYNDFLMKLKHQLIMSDRDIRPAPLAETNGVATVKCSIPYFSRMYKSVGDESAADPYWRIRLGSEFIRQKWITDPATGREVLDLKNLGTEQKKMIIRELMMLGITCKNAQFGPEGKNEIYVDAGDAPKLRHQLELNPVPFWAKLDWKAVEINEKDADGNHIRAARLPINNMPTEQVEKIKGQMQKEGFDVTHDNSQHLGYVLKITGNAQLDKLEALMWHGFEGHIRQQNYEIEQLNLLRSGAIPVVEDLERPSSYESPPKTPAPRMTRVK